MKAIPISAARAIGQKSGARQVIILALDASKYNITTWGKTVAECRLLARWAQSREAEIVMCQIAAPGVPLGAIEMALGPEIDEAPSR